MLPVNGLPLSSFTRPVIFCAVMVNENRQKKIDNKFFFMTATFYGANVSIPFSTKKIDVAKWTKAGRNG